LINILNNARDELLKSIEKKKLILIDVTKNEKFLEIIIKDNAGGIPENIIDKIFDAHFTTKHESEGTGIGLYMSKTIITEHMRGIIEVHNSEYIYKERTYTGAEFKITIPINLTT
ncbi:MAG: HAMP domain-containing histidine kinase, partial [Campylobacteraceae bacterium]|nr:HAMP domain-containing histidine kinase [Campylobacteraceae bacterium]